MTNITHKHLDLIDEKNKIEQELDEAEHAYDKNPTNYKLFKKMVKKLDQWKKFMEQHKDIFFAEKQ